MALSLAASSLFAQKGPGEAWGPGTTYYIDGFRGSDANNGLSVASAWQHLARLQKVLFKPGDSVLFRRGTALLGTLDIQARGVSGHPVVFGTYGLGRKPLFIAPDSSMYTIQISNADYVTLQDLEIVNKGSHRLAGRTGVKLRCNEYGVSHNLILNGLDIHDVNGSLIKAAGGGSGILIENNWKNKVSFFDSLLIENCVIRRTARNGIIWQAPYRRDNWHPSKHVVVRYNLLEGVPGDGIVPIGCDSALIEYNVMRDCPQILPSSEAAAGIWPWSCDNTIIQFNEVSGQKNQWDAQGFDADYNCQNTLIQYNYSHDNYGGMVLICNDGGTHYPYNMGNIGTVVRYNISINDGIRPKPARSKKMFSPAIHIAGPVSQSTIEHNIIHQDPVTNPLIDRTMLESDNWNGFADSTLITQNVFYASGNSRFTMNESTNNCFKFNYYLGRYDSLPHDLSPQISPGFYLNKADAGKDSGLEVLQNLLITRTVGDGAAKGQFVNKKAINAFLGQVFR